MTTVIRGLSWCKEVRSRLEKQNKTIGLVPTMGALHDGHLSLIKRSLKDNDITIVSIFVNPTQFDDPYDLKRYPKTFKQDMGMLEQQGVDFLFYPEYKEIYADNYRYRITEDYFSKYLCGNNRPGHFDGVLTIIMKLLNLIRPQNAYFGEKDYQQYLLIKEMVESFFMNTNIVACPTIREEDGLAMSSRNQRISPEKRKQAALFHQELAKNETVDRVRENLKQNNFEVDYVEEHFQRRFGAVKIDDVRIIDNVPLPS